MRELPHEQDGIQNPRFPGQCARGGCEADQRRHRARHGTDLIFDKNGRASLRIELQKSLIPFPDLFFDKIGLKTEFSQNKPNKTRMRTKWMMVKRRHALGGSLFL